MELHFDPVIPLLGLYTKNPKTVIQRNLCTPMFVTVLFTIAKIWKQTKCPSVDKWVKNGGTYKMEYYAAERKKVLLPFVTAWMELDASMLSAKSQ